MHRIQRKPLPTRAQTYLSKKQTGTNKSNVDQRWKGARQTKAVKEGVVEVLIEMARPRGHCMYCVLSEAGDIEHFWPKAVYPRKAFQWSNMLWCCTNCNRHKDDEFPLDAQRRPLLINPALDNPWNHLEFYPPTGIITVRTDPATGLPFPKGVETVRILKLDRRESLRDAYKKSHRRLVECVENALQQTNINPATLVERLKLADDHEIMAWCFTSTGATQPPFSDLRTRFPAAWAACVAASR